MKILLSPEVEDYLYDLVDILHKEEYFGFYESADNYVTSLVADIAQSIRNKTKKVATPYFSKYGKNLFYSIFKKNDNTQWYVFFNFEDDVYLIRYIGNNHTCSQYL